MRILITGASGFIGRRILQDMAGSPNTELFAISRSGLDMPGVTFLHCDVLDEKAVEGVFEYGPYDCVVHLAAITAHNEIVDKKQRTFETNLLGTINLLKSFNRHCAGGQFLYASTGKVYGKTNEIPITERAYINPTNILGKTKRITEEVIDLYAVPENRYLICRIFNIYGEHQRRNFVVPTILDQLDLECITLGNLKDLRDYLYIGDLSTAMQACMTHADHFAPLDHVNIGSGEMACVADILREIETLIGKKLQVKSVSGRFRQDETPVEFCSHDKLTALTGWTPSYSLAEGLEKTLRGEGVTF